VQARRAKAERDEEVMAGGDPGFGPRLVIVVPEAGGVGRIEEYVGSECSDMGIAEELVVFGSVAQSRVRAAQTPGNLHGCQAA
jgi:hypothetical protein